MFATGKAVPTLSPPTERFRLPIPVSQVLVAFPAKVDHLVPAMSEIPPEFLKQSNIYVMLAEEYFTTGGINRTGGGGTLKEGVLPEAMRAHMECVRKTFSLRQEHKIASLAFLFSCWVTIPRA